MALLRRLVPDGLRLMIFLGVAGFTAAQGDAKHQEDRGASKYADELAAIPTADQLRSWHDLLGSEPHVAGTPGDLREIKRIADAFDAMGLQTEVREFQAWLPHPVSAEVEIIGAASLGGTKSNPRRRGVIRLNLTEKNLLEDPASKHPGLDFGWNAFSGSGEVTAGVVYANYGTLEDFERLRELGVDVDGKIVIARYGKNYRGFKVKYAQEAGAAGLLMYLDPANYGYQRGETWPKGGWANSSCIQRGSVLVLPYKGDPLTPFHEATADAERLDPEHVGFPWIPVQPIGYAAASRILARMTGRPIEDDSWAGGLPLQYRLESGDTLEVRMQVEQSSELRTSANVIGRIEGAVHPEQFVVVGCHHDAWGFGAADPLAGTIVLMETARAVAEAAARGDRPERTILFAAWGAEEFGIIGSSEWVEGNADRLREQCVGYINLDMAAMGDTFNCSATPVLRRAIQHAVGPVPQSGDEQGRMLSQTWGSAAGGPAIGDLGGGSDHVGFVCHVGVPSIRLGGSGADGTAYHSNYDTLAWYRATIGDDYQPALMVTRACARVVAMLADSTLPPYEWTTVASEVRRHAEAHLKQARAAGLVVDLAGLNQASARLASAADALDRALNGARLEDPKTRVRVQQSLLAAERTWLVEAGLSGRPWYRNTYISDDPESGYSASPLPELHAAWRAGNADRFNAAVAACAGRIDLLSDRLLAIRACVEASEALEPGP
jgi:N-acetylated-alpha-linked acidic dipeptidase